MKEFHWCDFEWDSRIFPDVPGMLKDVYKRQVQAERIVKDANTQAGAMLDKAKADIRTEQENAMKAMESLSLIHI